MQVTRSSRYVTYIFAAYTRTKRRLAWLNVKVPVTVTVTVDHGPREKPARPRPCAGPDRRGLAVLSWQDSWNTFFCNVHINSAFCIFLKTRIALQRYGSKECLPHLRAQFSATFPYKSAWFNGSIFLRQTCNLPYYATLISRLGNRQDPELQWVSCSGEKSWSKISDPECVLRRLLRLEGWASDMTLSFIWILFWKTGFVHETPPSFRKCGQAACNLRTCKPQQRKNLHANMENISHIH